MKTVSITINGKEKSVVRSTKRVWSVIGLNWKLVEQVNNPGVFNLYNSAMRNTGETYRLEACFVPVKPL